MKTGAGIVCRYDGLQVVTLAPLWFAVAVRSHCGRRSDFVYLTGDGLLDV